MQKYGIADASGLLKNFSEEEIKDIKVQIKREKRLNPSTWWNIPLGLIMQMVYEVHKYPFLCKYNCSFHKLDMKYYLCAFHV